MEKRSFGPPNSPEGSLTHPHQGVAEAAGIATLPESRRMGIADAVTAALCAEAFRRGMTVVFLTAADEAAGRIYTRAGFMLTGTHQINISIPY